MKKLLKKLPFWRNFTTDQWKHWWVNREIDWNQAYLSTWNHPHRQMIAAVLKTFSWFSLLEVGCGAGANMYQILKSYGEEQKQLGGIDISPSAIETAKKAFNGAFFKVGSVEDIMMSDNSADVVLSDMTMIYVGPNRINKAIKEIKRVARERVVFCEFHVASFIDRLKLRMSSGYHGYNYVRLLEKHGFYDVTLYKIPDEAWPGGDDKNRFRYIVVAKVPRRKN
jgi:SAM-dependent methyltransferase